MSGFEKGKLSQEQIDEIIQDIHAGKSKTEIAENHGVKLSTMLYYSARGVRRNDKKKVKNYADYLKEENEKRKAMGWFQFKNGLAKEKAFGYNYK